MKTHKCPRCHKTERSGHCESPTCGWSVCWACDSVYDVKDRYYTPRKKV